MDFPFLESSRALDKSAIYSSSLSKLLALFLPWLSGNDRDDKFDCHLSPYRSLSPASSTLMLTTLQ
jgi:hypothetical protein